MKHSSRVMYTEDGISNTHFRSASCVLDFVAPRVPAIGHERPFKSIFEKESEASWPDVAQLLTVHQNDTDHYRIAGDAAWDISVALHALQA